MIQMGDRDACERIIHNLNDAPCFGNKLSLRYNMMLLCCCRYYNAVNYNSLGLCSYVCLCLTLLTTQSLLCILGLE